MELTNEVDEFLKQIEDKYATDEYSKSLPKDGLQKQLHFLSTEFDTLGLPQININQNTTAQLKQVISNTLLLVEDYRRALSQINDVNIINKKKDNKSIDLEKNVQSLRTQLAQVQNENQKLKANVKKLNDEFAALQKVIALQNKETEKIKKFFKSKQNDLVHNINSLKQENERLKDICGQNLGKRINKDDKLLAILKEHRHKEEVYKSAIRKLEENNVEIMNEILNLKAELTEVYSKNETT